MTKLNRRFDPSPENSIARVREISEHPSLFRRVLKCVPVRRATERAARVFHAWSGRRDWQLD